MHRPEQPPSYQDKPAFPQPSPAAPPSYDAPFSSAVNSSLPNHFVIGSRTTSPLVLPSDLLSHLRLLGAFKKLKEEVHRKAQSGTDRDGSWSIFLARAVYRFTLWVEHIANVASKLNEKGSMADALMPPIDVMMVWHTYMLNPHTYFEDGLRLNSGLLALGSFPLSQAAALVDPISLLPVVPSEGRVTLFESRTGQSYDCPIITQPEDTISFKCPVCSHHNVIPWIAPGQRGFGQGHFSANCSECKFLYNKESLAVQRFCDDVEKCYTDKSLFLAGTVIDPSTGAAHPDLARELTELIINARTVPSVSSLDLARHFNWKFSGIEEWMRIGYMGKRAKIAGLATPEALNRVMSCYDSYTPFSIELESAIQRQSTFVDQVYRLRWTEHDRFGQDNGDLIRAVARYHAFLDLMTVSNGHFVVPTIDIDLAWHTHQLLCVSYRDLHTFLGVVPDHDDEVDETALAVAYDESAEAWQERFGVPYSVCGCLPPRPDSEKESRLGFSSLFSRKGKSKATTPEPLINSRPDLVSTSTDDAAETHPSTHNSITFLQDNRTEAFTSERREENSDRVRSLQKRMEKGKAEKWRELVAVRALQHVPAFPRMASQQESEHSANLKDGSLPFSHSSVYGAGMTSSCQARFDQARGALENAILQSNIME
ncbi:hypothetical protein FRC03_002424 [Tulasnella sp. 419]|nr:hypothetical protein FRC03_002424 [Tulasnella sp. 419]